LHLKGRDNETQTKPANSFSYTPNYFELFHPYLLQGANFEAILS